MPPIAGIIVVDYFVLRTHKKELDASRMKGTLPETEENVNWVTLISWAAGFAVGYFVKMGIPSINSLAASAAVYLAGMLIVQAVRKNPAEEKIAS
ncbi:hypothetical protein MAHJHV51_55180 [Mycobacterium avium subsp. hominissuis]